MAVSTNWNYPTRIAVGAGRIAELGEMCDQLGLKNPLLVTDPGLAALPLFDRVCSHLEPAGVSHGAFTNLKPNPTGTNVMDGVRRFREGNHDGVVALGGGSALDVGKAIALVARQSCSLWDLEDVGDNYRRADASRIAPVVAIPTTAGTGSEVGRASLVTHEAERRKVIVFHPKMLPGAVILDPELTFGLPAVLTAATGMDALSHSLEAFCAPGYHPMAAGIAMEGIRLVKENLPAAVANGHDVDARLNMLVASSMGATAFQRGLGAMHALAHPLGAVYDAHHGMLNAVLMPYVLKANADAIRGEIARLATHLGLARGFDGFVDWVLALREQVGIPHTLRSVLTADRTFAEIGQMAVQDPSAGSNPVPFTAGDYQRIAEAALDGRL